MNFDDGNSKLIFSVIKRGETTGTANYNQIFLYQRYEYGSLSGHQQADRPRGTGAFGGARTTRRPTPTATPSLQVTSVPGQSDRRARRADLRHRNLHAPQADHAARSVRHHACRRRSIRSPISRARRGPCHRGNGMSRQHFGSRTNRASPSIYMAGIADAAAALHRPRRRHRPRLRGQGAADEGGRRRRAGRRAHAEQRQSAGGGGADLQRELPVRLHGHGAPANPDRRRQLLRAADRRRRPASTSSPSPPPRRCRRRS